MSSRSNASGPAVARHASRSTARPPPVVADRPSVASIIALSSVHARPAADRLGADRCRRSASSCYVAWRHCVLGCCRSGPACRSELFDDLYSGQPFGSAIMLWSIAAIALEIVETRLPWRNF